LRRPDVELVPAYLENMNRILPKGEVLPVPMLSLLTFGKPLQVEPGEEKERSWNARGKPLAACGGLDRHDAASDSRCEAGVAVRRRAVPASRFHPDWPMAEASPEGRSKPGHDR